MKRRQTKKELKRALENVQKPTQKTPPTLQEAWNVVATHLKEDGAICYFADLLGPNSNFDLHAAGQRTIVVSNL